MNIYFDYNATCPLRDSAKKALLDAYTHLGNSSSAHSFGRDVRSFVDHARRVVQNQLDAQDTRVIFTSGGTESNNLALRGLSDSVYISAIEHSAVKNAQSEPHMIPVTSEGIVDLNALEKLLKDAPSKSVVSVMLVNNETGVIQPVQEVARIAKSFGHYMHTDAVQGVGKIEVSFKDLGVDMLTLSSHKFGGPLGCGALLVKEEIQLDPILRGGGHEFGMRSGTLPMPLIHGMITALEDAVDHLDDYQKLTKFRDRIEQELCPPGIVHGQKAPRVSNTICISMPDVSAQLQLMSFDLAGIAVSVGSACSSGKVSPSAVLKAMHIDEAIAAHAIRVSLGTPTTNDEVTKFIEEWKRIYKNAQKAN